MYTYTMHTHAPTHMYTHTRLYKHIYKHTRMYKHIYTHTHTHEGMHEYEPVRPWLGRGEKKKLLSYFWWSLEEKELEKQCWIFDYYILHSVFNYYKKPIDIPGKKEIQLRNCCPQIGLRKHFLES